MQDKYFTAVFNYRTAEATPSIAAGRTVAIRALTPSEANHYFRNELCAQSSLVDVTVTPWRIIPISQICSIEVEEDTDG